MTISFDIFQVITAFGITQAFFFAILLFFMKRQNRRANVFIALFLLCVAYSISYQVMVPTGIYNYFPHYMKTFIPFQFTIGPLIYYYIKTLIFKKKVKGNIILHFVPLLICIGYLFPFFLKSASCKIEYAKWWLDPSRNTSPEEWIIWVCFQSHMIIYMIFSVSVINKYNKFKEDNISEIKKDSISWLRYIMFVFIAVGIFFLFISILLFNSHSLVSFNGYITSSVSVVIFIISLRGIMQPEIALSGLDLGDLEYAGEIQKYVNSPLDKDSAADCFDVLLDYMKDEKPYLKSELTLTDLARELSIPRTYLSQVINEMTTNNFNIFVNTYRVDEIKSLFSDPSRQNESILSLAIEAGFNSKAAFNDVFKKITGSTPSKYRKTVSDNAVL